MKRTIFFLLFLLSLSSGARGQKNHTYEVGKNLEIFNRLYRVLDEYYVDTLDPGKRIPDAIQYMLEGLDPYTEYIPADDKRNLEAMTTGKYAGIGAMIRYYKEKDRCVVSEPYEGMPAALAGVRAGDVILSIAGIDTGEKGNRPTDEYVASVSNQLRGDPGTSFVLEVERPGEKAPLRFEVHRASVTVPAVPYYAMVTDSTGYICLTTYTRGCADQVLKAMQELKQQGAKSLILDLRDNGGGLAIEAVDLVNLFVPKGKLILSMKGRFKETDQKYISRHNPADVQIPLVVLVNGHSASSSEITCGALQDLDRAVVMGERTYGKGLVQQPHELPHGAVLKLTTSHYYIPSGRCIQALDYSRRAESGEAYRTPDSLTRVFHTEQGREVRDGGGVTPDVSSPADTLPNLIYYLRASDCFMDYCTQYRNSHESIGDAQNFTLTDADWEDFKQVVQKSDFTYDRQTFKALQELRRMARSEGYAQSTQAEFDALEKKLSHDLSYDLEQNRKQIQRDLEAEIATRYYYKHGFYASFLRHDKTLHEAVALLRSPERYKSILRKP